MKTFNGIDFYLQTFVLFVGFIILILMFGTSYPDGLELASIGIIIDAGPIQLASAIVMLLGRAPHFALRRIHLLSCLLTYHFFASWSFSGTESLTALEGSWFKTCSSTRLASLSYSITISQSELSGLTS